MTLKELGLSDEDVQDIIASLVASDANVNWTYDDANDKLTASLDNSVSVDTLEATTSFTDANGTTHTGGLADSADVSSIQSSSDVTVTDTQTGTVSDGEFLQNSGGSLTGGTVTTEPNVPNWTADSNNPITKTIDGTFVQFPVGLNSDFLRVFYSVDSKSQFGANLELRFDGVTSGYDKVAIDGGRITGATTLNKLITMDDASDAAGVGMMDIGNNGNILSVNNKPLSAKTEFFNELDAGRNQNVTPPIQTIDIVANTKVEATLHIFGANFL